MARKAQISRVSGRPRLAARGTSLREALIGAGIDLLRTTALESLSLRQVASRAGVTHAATYRHFTDRSDLFAAIAEEGYTRFYEYQRASLAHIADDDFASRLRTLGLAYVRFVLEHAQYARIMFTNTGLEFRRHAGLVRASARTWRELRSVIRLGQKQGLVPKKSGRERTIAAWSMVHGIAMLLQGGQIARGSDANETEELVARVLELTFTGIGGNEVTVPAGKGED